MPGYQDSQPDGPEADDWQTPRGVDRQPHGFVEPSKHALLDGDARRRQRVWRRLLDDSTVSHEVWWARLMRVLRGPDA